jgi:hypothetical protein
MQQQSLDPLIMDLLRQTCTFQEEAAYLQQTLQSLSQLNMLQADVPLLAQLEEL